MIIEINDDFREKGLTLEEAFILARVRSFEDNGLEYNESNEALAEMIGKGKTTIKTCINELVEKGLLQKKAEAKNRVLFTQGVRNRPQVVKNEQHAEVEQKEKNKMSNEEFKQFLKVEIQKNKSRYNDSDEEFY